MITKFEGLYVFPADFDEESMDKAISVVKAEIEKLSGSCAPATRLGKRSFARPMAKKRTAGQYVIMDMEIDGEQVTALKARLKLSSEVVRVQYVKK